MRAPHNHKEWLAKRKAKQEEWQATKKKKKQPENDSSTKREDMDAATAEKGSTDSKKMKLKLSDSIFEGLTTHMSISSNDARKFVDKQVAEFDAANKTNTDDKSLKTKRPGTGRV